MFDTLTIAQQETLTNLRVLHTQSSAVSYQLLTIKWISPRYSSVAYRTLQSLVKLGLVQKDSIGYGLTDAGWECVYGNTEVA
jgi:DNA-binding IclR family transcriptional regulator